jgi:hypothetical protein
MVTQSPSRVPWSQSRMWSIAAFAALAAEERPRASMIAAPRFCTVGMNVFSSQAVSLISGQAFLPWLISHTSAWKTSGYCVAEWLPHTLTLRMALTGLASFWASCDEARLWSSRIMPVNCSGFRPGAFFIAMRQLVFAGLPTTSTLTLRLATRSSAWPCGPKILPFASSRSFLSMPGPRGRAPTSSAMSTSLNALVGSEAGTMSCSSGKAQSSSSIITPFSAFCAFSSGISSS